MKTYEVWGIVLFREVTLAIILFYVITVMLFVSGFYYVHTVLGVTNILPVFLMIFLLSIVIATMIATLSIEPLKDHFEKLEHLSKEILHELNLPISTINANTAMLRKGLSDVKSLKRLERIEGACTLLYERYGELDYLIKKQMQQETIEAVELQAFIASRLRLLASLYAHVNFSSHLSILHVRLDKIGLQKVIDNLIDNAVKYSDAPCEVRVTLEHGILKIIDNGRGMDEMELVGIFDRYYQNDATVSGYGIGLALVKNYCDRHKIKLHVKSIKGKGTTMILDFQGVEL